MGPHKCILQHKHSHSQLPFPSISVLWASQFIEFIYTDMFPSMLAFGALDAWASPRQWLLTLAPWPRSCKCAPRNPFLTARCYTLVTAMLHYQRKHHAHLHVTYIHIYTPTTLYICDVHVHRYPLDIIQAVPYTSVSTQNFIISVIWPLE